MRELLQDFRYGLRILLKAPGAFAISVLALSLGIGANTSIFSVMNAILIRPLPYRDSDHIVALFENKLDKGMHRQLISPLDYKSYVEGNRAFDEIGAVLNVPLSLTGRDLAERIEGAFVSPSIFQILGMRPALGRSFATNEDQPDKNARAIVSAGLARRRFGSDANALGANLTLNGKNYLVVGIAPPGFRLPESPSELWLPYTPDPKELAPRQRGLHTLRVLAHLKAGVTTRQAEVEMEAIARRLAEANPETNKGFSAEVIPLREQVLGNISATLWTLTGAVAFVLLIACANVANLLLARAGVRSKEIAVRSSLGASPGRIVRQMLAESILLASIGGLCGLALAYWGTLAIVKLAPAGIPRVNEISLDWRVLAFTFVLSILTGVLFGLAPALASVRSDLNAVLRGTGRGNTAGVARSRMRDILVVSEIACCVVLLACAGLLLRSFANLQRVNPGFRPDHVLTMQLALPPAQYPGLKVAHFYQQLLDRVQALPGVQFAGISRFLPLSGTDVSINFQIEGQPTLAVAEQPRAKFRATSADYFPALGIPLVRGRLFNNSDGELTPKVVVINEAAARRYWPHEDPIGRRIVGVDKNSWSTIVGIVGDVKHAGLDVETSPEMYYHYLQIPAEVINFAEATMFLAVRTAEEPSSIAAAIRAEARALDPNQPVFNIRTMQQVVESSIAQPRFRMLLLAVFAGLALVLAATGLYGVMSYSLTQRINEMGVRMALGAVPGDICTLVLAHGLRMALAGIASGLVLASASTWLISRLLFGVHAIDLESFGAICLLTMLVALAACLFPAIRAIRVDPAVALRAE